MNLLNIAEHDRSSVALLDGHSGTKISYGLLCDEVARAADDLRRSSKELVLCLCQNQISSIISYLASLESGHAVGLIDAASRLPALSRLIEAYRPEWIAVSEDLALELELDEMYARTWSPELALPMWRRKHETSEEIYRDLNLLLSTSGTTGSPKFVRLTRANIESNAYSISLALGLGNRERAITSLPIHYSYGLSVVNSHLSCGGTVVVTSQSVLERSFWEAFDRNRCTSFAGVPYTYSMLRRIGFEGFDLPTLRAMTQAGGRLDDATILRFHRLLAARGQQLHVMYGQTEATARICCMPPGELADRIGSVGPAIAGGRLRIENGEVVYSGPNVMLGYATSREGLGRGDELEGTLYTGDVGFLDGDGYLTLIGRNKRFAKVFGLRVNLEEIEDRLRSYGPTAAIAGEDRVVLFCEYGDLEELERHRRRLIDELTLHPTSLELRRIDRIPVSVRGKVDYGELEKLL